MQKTTTGAGKGSKPRPYTNYNGYVDNFEQIKNFGFKPKWQKSNMKVDLYPDQLAELMSAISNTPAPFVVTDSCKFSDFSVEQNNKSIQKLFKKYNLDENTKSLYILEIVEKMYCFRPF